MKSNVVYFIVVLLISVSSYSQDVIDNPALWLKGWTNFNPIETEYPEPEKKLQNSIDKDLYLSNEYTYLLSGNVYITNNAQLTIQEGTIIRCDTKGMTNLVITKGAKLVAKGSKAFPIVFTSNNRAKSRKSGDWGGIVIAGSGKTNALAVYKVIEGDFLPQYAVYGGTEENEATTELSYVRIEFAGKKVKESKGYNALSLYALGKKSILNNIMISYSENDSFTCFGGTVDLQNLISYKAKGDDYDFTLGYRGKLSTIMAIRHPYITDASGSYAIEIDGYTKNEGFISSDFLSNVSIQHASLINLSTKRNYMHTTAAIFTKNQAALTITDSRISGFANVVKFDASYTSFQDLKHYFLLENSVYNVHNSAVLTHHQSAIDNTSQLLQYNMYTNNFKNAEDWFTDPFNTKKPKFTIKDSNSYTVME
ncbi:hypothetical protein J8281_09720 [Aquimarina sp. U1-2]|uniref:hypothetical protein n=1 Tax=Aquimarina sp. U1-2 TaxID=2823141 RepID=UPI001AEC8E60|nr:hypothetical protein [Aquimarina sp. U1-2]MBP2832460.1 hypothetical protein [Aquimarina sp. U1-2]